MMQRWLVLLILTGMVSIGLGVNVSTAADKPNNKAELQKALNAEVLAQPFSVPKPSQVQPQPIPSIAPKKAPLRYRRPHVRPGPIHLGWGWHSGHRRHRYGLHHRHYWHY